MWVLPILVAAIGAFAFMDNLTTARSDWKTQAAVIKRKQTWLMSFLYIGTFGSFVGYSAAFPLLLKTQFPHVTAPLAFLGPLVGSLARPIGGLIADRLGGARVTFWNFCFMAIATASLIGFVRLHSFAGFLLAFLALFVTTGIGNGSTFKMVPTLFRDRRETAAVLGFISAVGALGAFFIPRALGIGVVPALMVFLAGYLACLLVTWWSYLRAAPVPAPELTRAEAEA
jgi:NNP family nitrate/nitrite transporter-like MFS transporter